MIYKAGKNNIADPLSRLVNFEPVGKSFDEAVEVEVNSITANAAPVAIKLKEKDELSSSDKHIQAVHKALYDGFWSELSKPFRVFELELCFVGNILLRGHKIVMPEVLRDRTLKLAHEGHPGITKMKQRLRSKVWWPKNRYGSGIICQEMPWMFDSFCSCTTCSHSPNYFARKKMAASCN